MITKIETADTINAFEKQVKALGVSFHPDDGFNEYVKFKENTQTYAKGESDLRNGLMTKSFDVCKKEGINIYDTMYKVALIETGMDKYIPLPSQPYPKNK